MTRTRLLTLMALAAAAAALNAHAQQFGQHRPHGLSAVNYLYNSTTGTWKSLTSPTTLAYNWSWYSPSQYFPACQAFTPLPVDTAEVNKFTQFGTSSFCGQGQQCNHTAPDASCLILFDTDNNGTLTNEVIAGSAFAEHDGRGENGAVATNHRLQFWFDDNWIARYMSIAYGRAHPIGLHDAGYAIRWRVVGGDNTGWPLYGNDNFVDQVALDGLYYANAQDFSNTKAKWDRILQLASPVYDWSDQRYEYAFSDTYYYGLWAILTHRLLAQWPSFSGRHTVLQHALSLRSNILSMQERTSGQLGNRLGWRSTCDAPTVPACQSPNSSLINTETTAVSVLALGAEAWRVYEPGFSPLSWCTSCSYFNRPHHALSGVVGLSAPGYMVQGLNDTFPAGAYTFDFHFRMGWSPGYEAPAVYIAVLHGGQLAASSVLWTSSLPANNEWMQARLTTSTPVGAATEIQVYWYGNHNIDVGPIRVDTN